VTGWPQGVTTLDHTADVGIRVRAPALDALFHRAARGMIAVMRGEPDEARQTDAGETAGEPAGEVRRVAVEAGDLETLLVAWLRELLFLVQVRDFEYRSARFQRLEPEGLEAEVRGTPPAAPETELKGVTYHGLAVERDDDGWTATVIFDV